MKLKNDYLSSYFTLNRRYSRSVNLERDLANADALTGYVITERAEQSLKRIAEGFAGVHAGRAWMLTGVYGTGKSAFAHFLASLCSPQNKDLRAAAENILRLHKLDRAVVKLLKDALPNQGFVRAVATAQREPIVQTLLRALRYGVKSFWDKRNKAYWDFTKELNKLQRSLAKDNQVAPGEVLDLAKRIAQTSKTGLLVVIDELGKCLEYAAQNRSAGDLYLLQQIAELSPDGGPQIYLLGILHQAFSEYGYGLGSVERNEWAKIQGRFEEIPFTESPGQMMRLVGQVIHRERNGKLDRIIAQQAAAWYEGLSRLVEIREITPQIIADTCPLHPVAALTLPQLCIRYAQNDRSLFTFLTSTEPYSLKSFLDETRITEDRIPPLKLDRLYDYFVESAGFNAASQHSQRWGEVKGLITEFRSSDAEELRVLKTIGILNLATAGGNLKASRQLVALSLCDAPEDKAEQKRWETVIDSLLNRGLITHRRQVDELRLWEGSDFNIDAAVTQYCEQQRASLASLLTEACPFRPSVIQRHSYQTGTLRLFEKRYLDRADDLSKCVGKESDGVIGYWVEEEPPTQVPPQTADQKPFVLICGERLEQLRVRALELAALKNILSDAAELQTDGVARREVRHRLTQARRLLDEAFAQTFEATGQKTKCWIDGKPVTIEHAKELNPRLSDLCDEVYKDGLSLWNELINRRELTSQGAKASRQVIEAMIEHFDLERLGLQGAGPEVSVYLSVLQRTGIHRQFDGVYGFHPPTDIKVKPVWDAIESFCLAAKDRPLSLDLLYEKLQQPPYGVKSGVIPVLFAAMLLEHSDDISIYREGTFIPVLGPEHFELLVKHPARFSVKHYEILGLRAQVFKELEDVLVNRVGIPSGVRNRTLLGVISPLLQFARRLPQYTQKTKRISAEAQAVRQALLDANEPDKLLFELLPVACGLAPIAESGVSDPRVPKELRARLISTIKELREAHEVLLEQCREYIYAAFGVRQNAERLREDLRSRASYLQGRSIERALTRFVFAATEELSDDKNWLEGLAMVIADKPSESWTDADADAFELKLSDIARRFKNLEAIIHDNRAVSGGRAEARRLTITRPDGTELHDVAWVEETDREQLDKIARDFLNQHGLDWSQQRALLAVLTEKVLGVTQSGVVAAFKNHGQIDKGEQEDETHPRIVRR